MGASGRVASSSLHCIALHCVSAHSRLHKVLAHCLTASLPHSLAHAPVYCSGIEDVYAKPAHTVYRTCLHIYMSIVFVLSSTGVSMKGNIRNKYANKGIRGRLNADAVVTGHYSARGSVGRV
jgi:hypothetical protein